MTEENESILNLPSFRKAKAFVWKDIGVSETDKLLRLTDSDAIKYTLQKSLAIQEDAKDRQLILLDMFYHAVCFCQKNSFSSEKTSCFLSIIKQTHELACETPFGNLGETLKFFKDLIVCHSVHRPPFSLAIFSPQEASAISYYFFDTYFRHFKLYKYTFTPQVQLDLSIHYTKIPKSQQELEEEKKTMQDELKASARSDGEVIVGASEAEADSGDQSERTNQSALDLKSASLKELKRIVRERLTAEMQDLKSSFTSQLKLSDDALGRLVATGAPATAAPTADAEGKKSGQQSAKRKK